MSTTTALRLAASNPDPAPRPGYFDARRLGVCQACVKPHGAGGRLRTTALRSPDETRWRRLYLCANCAEQARARFEVVRAVPVRWPVIIEDEG